jgi:uncharacterized protein
MNKPSRRRSGLLTRVLVTLLIALVLVYAGISVYVADKLSHPTRRALTSTPADYGMTYSDVDFASTVDNIPLKGWFMDSPGDKTILVMHGRNSTKDNRVAMETSRSLYQRGYDIFTFDFRAHGESGGDRYSLGPWEVRDVAGALNYLKSKGVTQVGGLAYSMGASTEILAAPDHPEIKALVADSPFADLSALLDKELPKNSGLPSLFNPGILAAGQVVFGLNLLDNKPERQMAQLKDRPVFLIHGDADALVPVSHAYRFQQAAANDPNFTLWIVPGAAHVGSYDVEKEEYLNRVGDFFDKNLK